MPKTFCCTVEFAVYAVVALCLTLVQTTLKHFQTPPFCNDDSNSYLFLHVYRFFHNSNAPQHSRRSFIRLWPSVPQPRRNSINRYANGASACLCLVQLHSLFQLSIFHYYFIIAHGRLTTVFNYQGRCRGDSLLYLFQVLIKKKRCGTFYRINPILKCHPHPALHSWCKRKILPGARIQILEFWLNQSFR